MNEEEGGNLDFSQARSSENSADFVPIDEAVRVAQEHQRFGRLAEAATLYKRILAAEPEQPEALHFLGLLYNQIGHSDLAIACLRRALESQEDYPDARCNLGNLLQAVGDLDGAESCYREVVRKHPDFVNAWNNLGVLMRRLERLEEAEWAYRQAIKLDPGHSRAYNNLGEIALKRGSPVDAIVACEEAIRLAPGFAEAYRNLAQALLAAQRPAEAVAASEHALELGGEAYEQLGLALFNQGLVPEALAALRQAWKLNSSSDNVTHILGNLLYRTGQTQEAIEVYRNWLATNPDNPVAIHMLAAWNSMMGEDIPARASDHYVTTVFDGFASSFDSKLEKLDYCAPRLSVEMLSEYLGEPKGDLRILDAGCGTGLSAPLLRAYASLLGGVDLSAAMIDQARKRQMYDFLVIQELTCYLEGCEKAFEVILSVDTLVYFGNLSPLVKAVWHALVPGGIFVFTLERAPVGEARGFRLDGTGRYSHDSKYVVELLEQEGFANLRLRDAIPRMECGEPVQGLVVGAMRPQDRIHERSFQSRETLP